MEANSGRGNHWVVGEDRAAFDLLAFIRSMRPAWMDQAACRGMSTANYDLFYLERGTTNAGKARNICAGCPVREECLDHALRTPEIYGVRGGLAERERRKLRVALGIKGTQRNNNTPRNGEAA